MSKMSDKSINALAQILYDEIFSNIQEYGEVAVEIYMQTPLNIAATLSDVMKSNNASKSQQDRVNDAMIRHILGVAKSVIDMQDLWGRMEPDEFFMHCLENRANDEKEGTVFENKGFTASKEKIFKSKDIQ